MTREDMKFEAEDMRDENIRRDPHNAARYQAEYEDFLRQIDEISDAQIDELQAAVMG